MNKRWENGKEKQTQGVENTSLNAIIIIIKLYE